MKVVILAGGMGSRLSEETDVRPKPLVEIGHRPLLWHIMKSYSHHGFNDFVICTGYLGDQITAFFTTALSNGGDVTFDFNTGTVVRHRESIDPWRVTLVDTGQHTQTAGRLLQIRPYLEPDEPFMMTYGDGVSDVDLTALEAFHRTHGRMATVTAVRPRARFGQLNLRGDVVDQFDEKPDMSEGWINGGFFVLEPQIFDYITGDVDWAREPMEKLACDGQLMARRHAGFWQCVDTLRDKVLLSEMWESGHPPWKQWA